MATPRERIFAVARGERPDKVPFNIWDNKVPDHATLTAILAWSSLCHSGRLTGMTMFHAGGGVQMRRDPVLEEQLRPLERALHSLGLVIATDPAGVSLDGVGQLPGHAVGRRGVQPGMAFAGDGVAAVPGDRLEAFAVPPYGLPAAAREGGGWETKRSFLFISFHQQDVELMSSHLQRLASTS